MANLIRVKQLDQADLSGFFNTAFIQTGILNETFVDKFTDQNISGIKTFVDGVNLNNIDNLSLSGVDIIITSGNVNIINPNVGTNSANLTVQGSGDFFKGIKLGDTLAGTAIPAISIYDGPNDSYAKISFSDGFLTLADSTNNRLLTYDFSLDQNGSVQIIAVDSKVVHNTTNETISGIKTFASRPTVNGTGVLLIGESVNPATIVYTTGNQTISGIKTFASFPTVNNTGIVYQLGNQNISGQKRFVDQDIVSTVTFNSLNQPSTFIGGFSGPGVFRFEVKPEYRPVVFPNPNYFYTGVNQSQPVEIYFNTGTSRWWYTVNNIFIDASPIVQASNSSARLPLNNWSGGDMRIYPTYSHNISHYIDGNDPIDVDRINGVAKTGAQTISGTKTFANSGVFSLSGAIPLGLPNNPLSVVGSGNNYVQINIQNRATGTTATADLVITANNGTDTTNYINLGINNSGYNDPAFSNGTGLDGYLFINGGNLDIGTQTPNTFVEFHVGGTTAARSIARITESGFNLISGTFTTLNRPLVNGSGVLLNGDVLNLPNTVVYTTGTQTISGVKTFFDSGIFSNGGVSAVALLNNPLSIVGSGNNYLQLNIQNRATGLNASADLVITANNGTDNSNFINLGINNVGYNDPAFTNGTGLDGYLFIDGGNLDIGTRTPGRAIEFHAGGTVAGSTIARISESGLNVVSGNLTVNSTGVLLSGQNSFILPFSHTTETVLANTTYYFSNLAYTPRTTTGQAKVVALDNFVARKASWTSLVSTFTPTTASTGYFVNFTRNTSGIISDVIRLPAADTVYNFGGILNPPVAVNINDEIGISLKTSPTLNNQSHSGMRNSVNVYCYN